MEYKYEFEQEIMLLNDESFSDFVIAAFERVPLFQMNEADVAYVKQVVKNVGGLCEVLDLDNLPTNLFITAALLHIICKYDEVEAQREYDHLHMFEVRRFLADLQNTIGRENYSNLMMLIESQAGFQAPIPQVMQNVDDPAHMWILPFAIKLAGGN